MRDLMRDYLATKVVSDLRINNLPEYVAEEIMMDNDGTRLIALVQEYLNDADIVWLVNNLRSMPSESFIWKLSVVITTKFMKTEVMPRAVKAVWEERVAYEARGELKWRMLDISPDYNAYAWHSIITHWDKWVGESLRYSGGAEHTIDSVIKKMKDNKYPDHKKWIYLAWLPVAADRAKALNVLTEQKHFLNAVGVDDAFEFLEYLLKENNLNQPDLSINPVETLKALRNRSLSESAAKEIVNCNNSNYIIDLLRQEISDDDVQWISNDLQRDSCDYLWMLSVFMAHSLISSTVIKELLINLWNERQDIDSRWLLLWRVLDISAEFNKPVWELIMANWSKWTYDFMRIMGGVERLCEGIERNLNSSSKPDFKKWVYVTMYTGVDDHTLAVNKITAAKKYLSYLPIDDAYNSLIERVVK